MQACPVLDPLVVFQIAVAESIDQRCGRRGQECTKVAVPLRRKVQDKSAMRDD